MSTTTVTDNIYNSDVQDWINTHSSLSEAFDDDEHAGAIRAYETDSEVGYVVSSVWWHKIANDTGLSDAEISIYQSTAYKSHERRFREATGERATDYPDDPVGMSCPLVVEKPSSERRTKRADSKIPDSWRSFAADLHSYGGVPERRAEVVTLVEYGNTHADIKEVLGLNNRSTVGQHLALYRDVDFSQAAWLVKNGPDV